MQSQKYILEEELRNLNSELPLNSNPHPYTVPEGYFEGLADSILAKVKGNQSVSEEIAELSPLLASISRSMPYGVPDNYFEQNIENPPTVTNEESLILSFISKEMPYKVPVGYFANFPETVLEKLTQPKARVISIIRRKWMRMAAAAVVTGFLALTGYLYFGSKSDVSVNNPEEWVAKKIKNVSNQDLQEFINTTDDNVIHNATAQNKPARTEIKSMLQDVSDKDLNAFLTQVPTDDELGTN
jgi:hypothetical protein